MPVFNDLFSETAAVLAIAAVVGVLASLLRQPVVVAFIIVGVLVGPVGTGWVLGEDPLDLLAELGIALLLFVVGLKLDLHLIRSLGPVVLVIGLIQVALTALLGFGLALLMNLPLLASVYVALGLAFSSTVIIVKLLSDKREINALHGRLALGILIVQDLVVVIAMIALTALAGESDTIGQDILMMVLRGTAFLTGVSLLMRYMLPHLLHRLARSRELLMLTAIAWALSLAAICQALDFSKEVGAFIAGVALATTPYREAISARLTALRDFLLLFFFIDLGAHLDPAQLADQLWIVLALSGFVLLGKPLIIATILGIAGYRKRTLGLTALTMGQISEFSLILAVVGLGLGHVDPGMVNFIIAVALVTIALSGYLISYAEPIYERMAFWFGLFQRRVPYREQDANTRANDIPADVILFGLGRYGFRMGLEFKKRGLNVLGIDLNPDLVRQESNFGFETRYGDAEDSDMLDNLPLSKTRWVVSSIRDCHVNLTLLHALHHCGYQGQVAMAAHRNYEGEKLRKAGVDLVLQPYADAADQAVDLVLGDDQRILPLEEVVGQEEFYDDHLVHIPAHPDSSRQKAPHTQVWHSMTVDEVLRNLRVDPSNGLDVEDAAKRLNRHGPNRLAEKPPRPAWYLFLSQFKSFLILVLIAAAVLAAMIGDIQDGIVILVVVVINAFLGFYQEYRAERSLAALKKMLALQAHVRRNGENLELLAEQLVPGDIVLLEAGDKIPADGRIITAYALETDESALTGESLPVAKQNQVVVQESSPLAERSNMLFMNNAITRGRAEMVVTATGKETEIGRLAELLALAEEQSTPLQIQLDSLGKRLALIALIVVVGLFASALWRGEPLVQTAFTAIALAVAAIPEGLPAVVTVTLALGMRRMAHRRAIVKRLAAVETLGCTTVICTDKTGTLTVNQMTARALFTGGRYYHVSGEGYCVDGKIQSVDGECPLSDLSTFLLAVALCNDSHLQGEQVLGDPMEAALLVLAGKGGLDLDAAAEGLPRIAEIPFDAEHKFMATFHRSGDKIKVFVKGAPEELVKMCVTELDNAGQPVSIQNEILHKHNVSMADDGLRVLGVAVRTLSAGDFEAEADLFQYVTQLNFAGLVGLMDPPRSEAREAIQLCQQAGIAVKMITGDQKVTAAAIARELGLIGKVVEGSELAGMDDSMLASRIDDIAVFARTAPEQKVRIIRALKAGGQVVAMTGDGVNDAPALKSADIGVAMGITGTDVAQEAATMVLTDDNFATIVSAIKEGRAIYNNMVKFVRFQLSTNIGAILTVASAPLLGLPIPFTAVQLLWINIIMDGPPAMALGVDRSHPDSMNEPPRNSKESILSMRRFGNLFTYGLTMTIGTLGVLYYSLQNGEASHAVTLAFTTFVLFQVFNIFNARAEKSTTFNRHFLSNWILWISIIGVIGLQYLVVEWPIAQRIFHTATLTSMDWAVATGVASSVLVLEELRKLMWFILSRNRISAP